MNGGVDSEKEEEGGDSEGEVEGEEGGDSEGEEEAEGEDEDDEAFIRKGLKKKGKRS